MREFTQAEKQQLQTKIEVQERKQRIVGEIIRKNKEAKRSEKNRSNWHRVEIRILGDNSLSAWL